MNTFKTALLLTALTLFLVFLGGRFGGTDGMIIALVIAAAMNFFSYFYSDKLALAMYRAQPVTREQLPRAYQVVERMTQRMGLPMPKIYVIPNESPNAFATGRNPKHASVAVTEGILSLLNDEELEGVLAHEAGAREESRYPHQFDCRHACRSYHLARTHGLVGRAFWGYGRRTRRSGARRRRGRLVHADSCSDRRDPDSARGIPLPRV